MPDSLDKLGKLLVGEFRDRSIEFFDMACEGRRKAPRLQQLQVELSTLTPEQQVLARRALIAALDGGLHDFLFALEQQHDFQGEVSLIVDGQDAAELSDGLHGELWTDDGWIARFSRYPTSQ